MTALPTTLDGTASDANGAPQLAQLSSVLVPELRRYLYVHRSYIESTIARGSAEAGLPAGRRYAKVYDGLLSSLFHAARNALSRKNRWVPLTLGAVGSYGRGTLSPGSDLDVRMVCEGDAASATHAAEALLYPLWDAGLSVGHQVVTVEDVIELSRGDLPTATSLLDLRVIASDSGAGEALMNRIYQGLFSSGNLSSFVERLEARTRERHERFGGSVYLLEPDVKSGEGGLRDLDVAHWATRARYRVGDLSDLVGVGVLVAREWAAIESARNFLFRVRNLLHLSTGRRTDRLSFDQQEKLANTFGYGIGGAAVEHFMSDYYRSARTISRAREMLCSKAIPPSTKRPRDYVLGGSLKLRNGALSIVGRAALEQDPALALRLYDEAISRNVEVYEFARHSIARATSNPDFCAALRASPEACRLFTKLVCVVQQTKLKRASILAELHDVGLLIAMIPEFAPVVGRVHHDVYHVYTVDVHSVAAVDQLRALCRGDLASEHPLACRLAAEITRPPTVLFFSTLLHDIGKDLGGKGHADRGAELARRILERLGIPEADIVEVQSHVRGHLRMYHVATRRDVDDPRTIAEFADETRGPETLRELYLLTVSDVTTTSPTSMTSWKRRMLDELYVATERHFAGSSTRTSRRTEEARRQVVALWPEDRDPSFIEHFLTGLPERYLLANAPEAVVQHALFAERAQTRPASLCVVARSDPYAELWVVADDRPGLLAMITATFSRARLKVLTAQIYSWIGQDGRSRSLDIFWVRGQRDSAVSQGQLSGLERDLFMLLAGELDAVELATSAWSRGRFDLRPTPQVVTKVNLDNRSAANHTIVEVITRDRPALLFWLSNTIQAAGLSIWFAKINTEGERVADVFYVSDELGRKILDNERLAELEQRLLRTVLRLESHLSSEAPPSSALPV